MTLTELVVDLVADTGEQAMKPLWENDGKAKDINIPRCSSSSDINQERITTSEEVAEEERYLEEMIDEESAVVYVELIDGRMECENIDEVDSPAISQTRVSVETVQNEEHLVVIRLATQHHAFSLKRSKVTRNVRCFYQLQSGLKEHYPWLSIPGLPLRPSLWVSSIKWRNEQLANFLGFLISDTEFLSSRALHLFLQTGLSMENIEENIIGKRDDQVIVDKSHTLRDTMTSSNRSNSGVFKGGSRIR